MCERSGGSSDGLTTFRVIYFTLFSLVNVIAEAVCDEITNWCAPDEISEGGHTCTRLGGQYARLVPET